MVYGLLVSNPLSFPNFISIGVHFFCTCCLHCLGSLVPSQHGAEIDCPSCFRSPSPLWWGWAGSWASRSPCCVSPPRPQNVLLVDPGDILQLCPSSGKVWEAQWSLYSQGLPSYSHPSLNWVPKVKVESTPLYSIMGDQQPQIEACWSLMRRCLWSIIRTPWLA